MSQNRAKRRRATNTNKQDFFLLDGYIEKKTNDKFMKKNISDIVITTNSKDLEDFKKQISQFLFYNDTVVKNRIILSKEDMKYYIISVFLSYPHFKNRAVPTGVHLSGGWTSRTSKFIDVSKSSKNIFDIQYSSAPAPPTVPANDNDISKNIIDEKYLPTTYDQGFISDCFANSTAYCLHSSLVEPSSNAVLDLLRPCRFFIDKLYLISNNNNLLNIKDTPGLTTVAIENMVHMGVPLESYYKYDFELLNRVAAMLYYSDEGALSKTSLNNNWDKIYDVFKDNFNELFQKITNNIDSNLLINAKTNYLYNNISQIILFKNLPSGDDSWTTGAFKFDTVSDINKILLKLLYWGFFINIVIPIYINPTHDKAYHDKAYDKYDLDSCHNSKGGEILYYPPSAAEVEKLLPDGLHALVLIGYDFSDANRNKWYFLVKNSWGDQVGGGDGNFKIDHTYFNTMLSSSKKHAIQEFSVINNKYIRINEPIVGIYKNEDKFFKRLLINAESIFDFL